MRLSLVSCDALWRPSLSLTMSEHDKLTMTFMHFFNFLFCVFTSGGGGKLWPCSLCLLRGEVTKNVSNSPLFLLIFVKVATLCDYHFTSLVTMN